MSVIILMPTGRPFHALGAATENVRSDETSLERGITRSCLPAERREARSGMLAQQRNFFPVPAHLHCHSALQCHLCTRHVSCYFNDRWHDVLSDAADVKLNNIVIANILCFIICTVYLLNIGVVRGMKL